MVSPLASGAHYRGHERYHEEKASCHRRKPENSLYRLLVGCAVRPAVYEPICIMPVSLNRLIGENPQDSKESDSDEAGGAEAA
jgi:hypothetical protein